MTITGAEGRIRWGYRPAAILRAWTMTKSDGVWTLSGTLAEVDDVAMSQPSLTFVLPNGGRWRVVSLQMTGASASATLGPLEVPYVPASASA